MSQEPGGQPVLAAFTKACGLKSGPVRATWSAVVPVEEPVALPAGCPVPWWSSSASPTGSASDDRDPVARQLVLRPDPAPQEDRRREVRARREDDDAGVDPLARRRDHAHRARRRPAPAGRPGCRRATVRFGLRASRVEVRERRVPARPLDDVRRKRRPADGLRGIVGVVEHGKARAHPPPRGTRRGAARARPCWRRRRGACRARGQGRARRPRSSRRGPIRRSPRASRRPPCTRCGWSSRRSPARRASGRPRRPCPSRA